MVLGQATGWSPLLLTELALGTQGSQDGWAGAQTVAPTALLQLLDSGQDLPLLRVRFLRLHSCPDPTLATPTPTPASTHLPPLLKVDEIPLGENLSELESPGLRIEGQGQGLECQEPYYTKGAGVGIAGRVKGEMSGGHCAEGKWYWVKGQESDL